MKAILEFDLDNPDDKKAHLRCVKSLNMACVLFEITTNLQKKLGEDIKAEIVFEAIQEELEDNHLNMEELLD